MEQFDWYDSYDKHVSKDFTYPECTLYEMLENTVARVHKRRAIVFLIMSRAMKSY